MPCATHPACRCRPASKKEAEKSDRKREESSTISSGYLFNMVYPTSHTQTGLWLRVMFAKVTYIGAWTSLDTQNVDSKINCGYCLHMGEGSALQ